MDITQLLGFLINVLEEQLLPEHWASVLGYTDIWHAILERLP